MKKYLAYFVLYYLRFFARLQLKKHPQLQIIGVTGSAGKSSTRNAIYQILKGKYRVKASFSANSESGIPLDILGLSMRDYSLFDWARVLMLAPIKACCSRIDADYYIVEMGIDSPHPPKNMEFLLSIIRPNQAVFLSVGVNHAFAFDHLVRENNPLKKQNALKRLIGKEKAKLVLSLPKQGLAILNKDDKFVMETSEKLACKSLSFGQAATADLRITDHQIKIKYDQQKQLSDIVSSFEFVWQNLHAKQKKQKMRLEFEGLCLPFHYAHSLAAALLLGSMAGLSLQEMKKSLEEEWRPPAGRASVIGGRHHSLIIDSSYNASSMQDFIDLFASLKLQHGRKIALLGDMRELGDSTATLHQNLAKTIAPIFDEIHLVGQSMSDYALPILQEQGHSLVFWHPSSQQAGKVLRNRLQKNDLLLVKGSQNTIFLEEAIKQIMAKSNSAKLLCRQSAWWMKVKLSAS